MSIKDRVLNLPDPTYSIKEIKKNPQWHVAWVLSEIMNDQAPLGWSKYIYASECLLGAFDIKPKNDNETATP